MYTYYALQSAAFVCTCVRASADGTLNVQYEKSTKIHMCAVLAILCDDHIITVYMRAITPISLAS